MDLIYLFIFPKNKAPNMKKMFIPIFVEDIESKIGSVLPREIAFNQFS